MKTIWIIATIFIVITMLLNPLNSKQLLAKTPENDEHEYPKYVIVDKGDNKKSLIELSGPRQKTPESRIRLCDGKPMCFADRDCAIRGNHFCRCRKPWTRWPSPKTCKNCQCGTPGRPFTVKDNFRTANSQICNSEKNSDASLWTMQETTPILTNDSDNQLVGRRWLEQAEGEHASVASFARHTLQLMAIGAPPDLLTASQNAAIDEIRHAKLCYGFASAFLKSEFGPSSLDIEYSLSKLDLKGIVESIIKEGCIEETISAAELRFRASTAKDPSIKLALSQIGEDEARHAQLAWDTIQWITTKFPELSTFVEELFSVELENQVSPVDESFQEMPIALCLDNNVNTVLRNYGLLTGRDQLIIRKSVMEDVIKPIYLKRLKDVSSIAKHLIKMDFNAV